MWDAEEKLKVWRALYREWSDVEHRLHSSERRGDGPSAAEMKARSHALQQRCASALHAFDSAVDEMRQHRDRRENLS